MNKGTAPAPKEFTDQRGGRGRGARGTLASRLGQSALVLGSPLPSRSRQSPRSGLVLGDGMGTPQGAGGDNVVA